MHPAVPATARKPKLLGCWSEAEAEAEAIIVAEAEAEAPAGPRGKKQRKSPKWQGVEDYDYVLAKREDKMIVPESMAGDKRYTQVTKYWRCFGPECQARVDTLLDGMSVAEIHWSSVFCNDVPN